MPEGYTTPTWVPLLAPGDTLFVTVEETPSGARRVGKVTVDEVTEFGVTLSPIDPLDCFWLDL